MMDLSEKLSESESVSSKDTGSSSEECQANDLKKTCADCGTTKTPLWRGGPAGPKSLCNACGIRSRKKRRALLGIKSGSEDKKLKKGPNRGGSNANGGKLGDSIKRRMVALGREMMVLEKQRKKLGEVEQAAVLLMALSYGSVFA